MILFVGYKNCSTSNRAQAWLDARNVGYVFRDIKTENPTAAELKCWHKKSGLPLKRFFNTSGLKYKELRLKDVLPDMSEEEQLELLSTDGMLVKRPVLVLGDTVYPGFKESDWEKILAERGYIK